MLVLLVALLFGAASAEAMSVRFISPGHPEETYWADVSRAMQNAADDLGIDLQVDYAGRDLLREVDLVRDVVRQPLAARPDYLILAGEKRVLAQQLQLAESAGIPAFVTFNAPSAEERKQLGAPRERFRHWLGSLIPQAELAGYLTAKQLIDRAHRAGLADAQGRLQLLAIGGDRVTDSSVRRNAGLKQALDEHPEVLLHQMVYAEWRRDKAEGQMEHLLRRYPATRLVWAGNDEMAFGAMAATARSGRTPGRDVLFSGINASTEAMHAVIDGRLTALAGGHYLQGAWALVMLHDYHHGRDFADSEGLEMVRPLFRLFTPAGAREFLRSQGRALDFRRHSLALNPQKQCYVFQVNYGQEAGG